MLTRLGVLLDLVRDRATCALQEQVCAFAAGKFALRANKTCHLNVLFSATAETREPPGLEALAAVGLWID